MYNISLERCYSSASAHVCCINIHAEMTEILQGKDWSFIFSVAHSFWQSVSRFLIKYSYYLTHKSHKMVDNKSKTSLIRHIQKNISLTKINNIILVLRTRIILLSSFVIYFFCICHSGRFPIMISSPSTYNQCLMSSFCGIKWLKSISSPLNRMPVCHSFTSPTTCVSSHVFYPSCAT